MIYLTIVGRSFYSPHSSCLSVLSACKIFGPFFFAPSFHFFLWLALKRNQYIFLVAVGGRRNVSLWLSLQSFVAGCFLIDLSVDRWQKTDLRSRKIAVLERERKSSKDISLYSRNNTRNWDKPESRPEEEGGGGRKFSRWNMSLLQKVSSLCTSSGVEFLSICKALGDIANKLELSQYALDGGESLLCWKEGEAGVMKVNPTVNSHFTAWE